MIDDSLRFGLLGLITEHHGAQAQSGYFEIASAEVSVVHRPTVSGLPRAALEHASYVGRSFHKSIVR